jgi:hypothetical protein
MGGQQPDHVVEFRQVTRLRVADGDDRGAEK